MFSVFTEFDGIEIRSRVVFNKREVQSTGLTSDDFSGPTVSFSVIQSACCGCSVNKIGLAVNDK